MRLALQDISGEGHTLFDTAVLKKNKSEPKPYKQDLQT